MGNVAVSPLNVVDPCIVRRPMILGFHESLYAPFARGALDTEFGVEGTGGFEMIAETFRFAVGKEEGVFPAGNVAVP